MQFLNIIIIYLIFSAAVLLINYYISLVRSKETYSRAELINPLPIFSIVKNRIADMYPTVQLTGVIIIFSLAGIVITHFIGHWIAKSALIPVLMFLIFPFIKKTFDEERVLQYEDYTDMLKNVFIRMNEIVFYSYSFGAAASIIYAWSVPREILFIEFVINIVVIASITTYTLQKNIHKEG